MPPPPLTPPDLLSEISALLHGAGDPRIALTAGVATFVALSSVCAICLCRRRARRSSTRRRFLRFDSGRSLSAGDEATPARVRRRDLNRIGPVIKRSPDAGSTSSTTAATSATMKEVTADVDPEVRAASSSTDGATGVFERL